MYLSMGMNGSLCCCCCASNIRRVQSFDCILQYSAIVIFIVILKVMRYNNCSSILLRYCDSIELLPSPSWDHVHVVTKDH